MILMPSCRRARGTEDNVVAGLNNSQPMSPSQIGMSGTSSDAASSIVPVDVDWAPQRGRVVAFDSHLGFAFHAPVNTGPADIPVEPIVALRTDIEAASTQRELRALLHPSDLFEDIGTEEKLYDFTKKQLKEIVCEGLTHLQMAQEDTTMHKMCIEPVRLSIKPISLREKWPQEMIHQGVLSNTGWLEEVDTPLSFRRGDDHERTPNISSGGGAPPTMRKSSAYKFLLRKLLSRCRASLQDGGCTCVNGTMKGHRTNLHNTRRSGVTTDELSTVYKTSWTEEGSSAYLATRPKMCILVNCEADSAISGLGKETHDVYSFRHWGRGQLGPATSVRSAGGRIFEALPFSICIFPASSLPRAASRCFEGVSASVPRVAV